MALFEPTATQVEAAGQGYVLTSIGQESGEIPLHRLLCQSQLAGK